MKISAFVDEQGILRCTAIDPEAMELASYFADDVDDEEYAIELQRVLEAATRDRDVVFEATGNAHEIVVKDRRVLLMNLFVQGDVYTLSVNEMLQNLLIWRDALARANAK